MHLVETLPKSVTFSRDGRAVLAIGLTWCEIDWRESVLRSGYYDKNTGTSGSVPTYRSSNKLKTIGSRAHGKAGRQVDDLLQTKANSYLQQLSHIIRIIAQLCI